MMMVVMMLMRRNVPPIPPTQRLINFSLTVFMSGPNGFILTEAKRVLSAPAEARAW